MIILGTNSIKDTGYDVANSLRFNSGDSPSLSRTSGGSPSSTTKGTFSFWLKRSKLGINDRFVTTNSLSNPYFQMYFDSNASRLDQIRLQCYNGGSALELITNQKFRDTSAWYNIILSYDSTPSTPSSSSIKLFVNGTQVTSFATATYPSQNQNHYFNQGLMRLSGYGASSSDHTDGYMAEVVYCDGQALNADSFGEFDSDSGIWKPIDVSGLTFGTNGFYLDFEDSSALGNDVSGNNNDFTVNNLTAIDQSTDTCTNNFSTLNPLNVPTSNAPTFAEGNLFGESVTGGTSTVAFGGSSTFGLTQGKWYLEAKCGSSTNRDAIGVTGEASECARTNNSGISRTNSSYLYSGEIGQVYVNTVATGSFSTFTNNDIIMIALDLDNLAVYFGKNGTWGNSGDPTSGASKTGAISLASISSTTDGAYFINHGSTAGGGAPSGKSVFNFNFGSPPYAISSGNSDGNGYGLFEYQPPSGYLALCTKNLATDG